MHNMKRIKRYLTAIFLVAATCPLGACAGLNSPIDRAYYTAGSAFSQPGGYTRTIFSSSNF